MISNIIFGLLYIWSLEITRYEKIPKMIGIEDGLVNNIKNIIKKRIK
ncbi:hypothetical protein OAJ46_01245 [Candidatus Pelagibacter sp.]|nr:hypothetical protein [Candidatus Pelagibacter sp.]